MLERIHEARKLNEPVGVGRAAQALTFTLQESAMATPIQDLPGEIWKPVVGWEGLYEVSNLGRIKSLARFIPFTTGTHQRGRHVPEKLLKGVLHPNGYRYVTLSGRSARHERPSLPIHELVLTAFVGTRPPGHVARHYPDRTTTNNALSNLAWGTQAENVHDSRTHGTMPLGENCSASVLTADDVRAIRASRISSREWAARLGVHKTTIERARSGRRWAHIKG